MISTVHRRKEMVAIEYFRIILLLGNNLAFCRFYSITFQNTLFLISYYFGFLNIFLFSLF